MVGGKTRRVDSGRGSAARRHRSMVGLRHL